MIEKDKMYENALSNLLKIRNTYQKFDRVKITNLVQKDIKLNKDFYNSTIDSKGTFFDTDGEFCIIIVDKDEFKSGTLYHPDEIEKIEENFICQYSIEIRKAIRRAVMIKSKTELVKLGLTNIEIRLISDYIIKSFNLDNLLEDLSRTYSWEDRLLIIDVIIKIPKWKDKLDSVLQL